MWPFNEASIDRLAQKTSLSPRGFLQVCTQRFGEWLDKKSDKPIHTDADDNGAPPLDGLFLREWNQTLTEIRKSALTADNQQEERLFAGIQAALKIAEEGRLPGNGVQIVSMQPDAIKQGKNDPRPSVAVRLGVGTQAWSVVVAVTKKNSGVPFGAYFSALDQALGGDTVGAVLARPTSALALGPEAQARLRYDEAVQKGQLRPFPLDHEKLDFEQTGVLASDVAKGEHRRSSVGWQGAWPSTTAASCSWN